MADRKAEQERVNVAVAFAGKDGYDARNALRLEKFEGIAKSTLQNISKEDKAVSRLALGDCYLHKR
eukprot:1596402-Pleurochrysis_carterae.AAC.1